MTGLEFDLDLINRIVAGGLGLSGDRRRLERGFPAVLSATTGAIADGQHSAVFVAGSTYGWLLWNTDSNPHTPDEAVRLVGQNNVASFGKTDLM